MNERRPDARLSPAISMPEELGEAGKRLWTAVTTEYVIGDSAGLLLVEQAARAADVADALSAEIAKAGAVIRTEKGAETPHPAIASMLSCRSLIARCLKQLGLLDEPLLAPGQHRVNRSPWRKGTPPNVY
jgi:hypothetical protein